MNEFPDFSPHHYQIEKELGSNRAGGRVTYLAIDNRTQQKVVIKQFQFARTGASWSEYDAYEREIQLLKDLNHSGIPKYLDAFQTDDGFCMVQEYKNALSLAVSRSFTPDQIKKIAGSTLEILAYLQNRIPPVIHRDIKPENILVDDDINVYLVDFGFARIGDGEVGVSSVVKGTLGFMPPEQLFNRQLTEASDLYGLGITLICLLTNTKSTEIGSLIDITYRINFKHLVPKLSIGWVNWLEKMTEPKLKDRFPNAEAALAALPAYSMRLPEPIFNRTLVNYVASRPGAMMTQTVTINNLIPETVLAGTWEVAPHPSDPPHTPHSHTWIDISPKEFQANQAEFRITVDTTKLRANKLYSRKLLLHTNALPKTTSLNVQVKTAPLPIKLKALPYGLLSFLLVTSFGLALIAAWFFVIFGKSYTDDLTMMGFSAVVGLAVGLEAVACMMSIADLSVGATANAMSGILTGLLALLLSGQALGGNSAGLSVWIGAGVGAISGAVTGFVLGLATEKLVIKEVLSQRLSIFIALLIAFAGSSLGLVFTSPFVSLTPSPLLIGLTVVSNLLLLGIVISSVLHQVKLISRYKKSEQHLIKP